MLPKTFSVRSLQRNLNFGLGAGVKLPGVKRIDVTFGKDTCPAKAALSSLYVNELPRLHVANPTISFRTLAEEPTSHLSILLGKT
ncbi:hypothetical protein DFS34DRAFT_582108 [Phlyctochytrium arcticum]|nr:hypothetical protein DFS34DRAFT_582108 [Phlyctochytrium arcticum]